jgi:hypothetical protein
MTLTLLSLVAMPALAYRLDEYLQATIFQSSLETSMRRCAWCLELWWLPV